VTLKEATVGGPLTRISERMMRGESEQKQAVTALALTKVITLLETARILFFLKPALQTIHAKRSS
jgi:hypothetical protein